ncbi:hypothetical protein ACTXT7_012018, partial [Hymenolepis weldensis]
PNLQGSIFSICTPVSWESLQCSEPGLPIQLAIPLIERASIGLELFNSDFVDDLADRWATGAQVEWSCFMKA